jgi:hypothetical protein
METKSQSEFGACDGRPEHRVSGPFGSTRTEDCWHLMSQHPAIRSFRAWLNAEVDLTWWKLALWMAGVFAVGLAITLAVLLK